MVHGKRGKFGIAGNVESASCRNADPVTSSNPSAHPIESKQPARFFKIGAVAYLVAYLLDGLELWLLLLALLLLHFLSGRL
jgi:hypothetical protein